MEDLQEQIKELTLETERQQEEIKTLKEHLKKYTQPDRNKKYYENNKEKVKERVYKNRQKKKEEKLVRA